MNIQKVATVGRGVQGAGAGGLIRPVIGDRPLDGRTIELEGRALLNWGTRSVSALEHHEVLAR